MNEIIQMFGIAFGIAMSIIGYVYLLDKIFSEHKFNKIFLWSKRYAEKKEQISGILIALECVLSFVNIPMLILSNWRLRL